MEDDVYIGRAIPSKRVHLGLNPLNVEPNDEDHYRYVPSDDAPTMREVCSDYRDRKKKQPRENRIRQKLRQCPCHRCYWIE